MLNPQNSNYILCADAESILHPELLGLEGESVIGQPWIKVYSDALEARNYARFVQGPLEAWVAGSDQMEAVNLAAAMKLDRPDATIALVSFDTNGSLVSRARVAGVTQVLDKRGFLERYKAGKYRFLTRNERQASQSVFSVTSQIDSAQAPMPGFSEVQLMPSGMPLLQPQMLPSPLDPPAPTTRMSAAQAQGVVSANSQAYILTIVGAGGGAGTSSVAALCACYAQSKGRKTLLVDADFQFGDLAYIMGLDSPLRIDELMESPLRVEGLTCADSTPALLAAPTHLERSELVSSRLPQIMDSLRSRFDVIVVSAGTSWGDAHIHLLETSSNTLFLMDQRPSSVRACRHALELCSRCGIASQPFLFALNRCSKKALFSVSDVSGALQGVRVFEFMDGGSAVEEQLGCGNPQALLGCGNQLLSSIAAFMDDVLPRNGHLQDAFSEPASPPRKWGKGKRRFR